jgi:hypothetical protein
MRRRRRPRERPGVILEPAHQARRRGDRDRRQLPAGLLPSPTLQHRLEQLHVRAQQPRTRHDHQPGSTSHLAALAHAPPIIRSSIARFVQQTRCRRRTPRRTQPCGIVARFACRIGPWILPSCRCTSS